MPTPFPTRKNVKTAFLDFERRLTTLSIWLACLMLVIAVSMGMLQVLMRFVFELPSEWSEVIVRSEEHTSELQSLMRISYAVFCLKKKKITVKSKYHSSHI